MNVDRRYYIPPHTGTSAINLHPGYQKLDGGEALSYVRYRHTDSDIYRTGRQQLFLEALKSRLRTGLSTLRRAEAGRRPQAQHRGRARPAAAAVTPRASSSRTSASLYHLPGRPPLPQRDPDQRSSTYFTTAGGADVLQAVAAARSRSAVHSFLHPNVRDAKAVSDQFGGRHKTRRRRRSSTSCRSRGSRCSSSTRATTPGEAANTTYLLDEPATRRRRCRGRASANAPKVQRDTTVYYDPVQPNAQQAAQQLRPLFGSHTRVAQMTTADRRRSRSRRAIR